MSLPKPTFARHESFYPRVGWLWKAVTMSAELPDIFLRDDAPLRLGVGKNMVRAIRYWGTAMHLLHEYPDPEQPRRSLSRPTRLGSLIFADGGWDPYLEDPQTIWLLHWMLTRPLSAATAWQLILGSWSRTDFTDRDAVAWLRERSESEPNWPAIPDASFRRDVQCLLQMYGHPPKNDRGRPLIESPFRDLGLLILTPGDQTRWRFTYGDKPGLSNAVVAFSCLDFVARQSTATTVTVSRMALEPGSPGITLRLTESQIGIALEAMARVNPGIEVIAPAGVRQLAYRGDPTLLAVEILAGVYGRRLPAMRVDELLGDPGIVSSEAA